MRRTTLTLGLGAAALAAVAVAPRLSALVAGPVVTAEVTVEAVPEAQVMEVVREQISAVEVPVAEVVAIPRARPLLPVPARPSHVIEMKTSASQGESIPELDQAVVVAPTPVVEPYWDDCPACGMG